MAICWGSWRNEGMVRDSGDGSGVPCHSSCDVRRLTSRPLLPAFFKIAVTGARCNLLLLFKNRTNVTNHSTGQNNTILPALGKLICIW